MNLFTSGLALTGLASLPLVVHSDSPSTPPSQEVLDASPFLRSRAKQEVQKDDKLRAKLKSEIARLEGEIAALNSKAAALEARDGSAEARPLKGTDENLVLDPGEHPGKIEGLPSIGALFRSSDEIYVKQLEETIAQGLKKAELGSKYEIITDGDSEGHAWVFHNDGDSEDFFEWFRVEDSPAWIEEFGGEGNDEIKVIVQDHTDLPTEVHGSLTLNAWKKLGGEGNGEVKVIVQDQADLPTEVREKLIALANANKFYKDPLDSSGNHAGHQERLKFFERVLERAAKPGAQDHFVKLVKVYPQDIPTDENGQLRDLLEAMAADLTEVRHEVKAIRALLEDGDAQAHGALDN